jgi:hypothetical protein
MMDRMDKDGLTGCMPRLSVHPGAGRSAAAW